MRNLVFYSGYTTEVEDIWKQSTQRIKQRSGYNYVTWWEVQGLFSSTRIIKTDGVCALNRGKKCAQNFRWTCQARVLSEASKWFGLGGVLWRRRWTFDSVVENLSISLVTIGCSRETPVARSVIIVLDLIRRTIHVCPYVMLWVSRTGVKHNKIRPTTFYAVMIGRVFKFRRSMKKGECCAIGLGEQNRIKEFNSS